MASVRPEPRREGAAFPLPRALDLALAALILAAIETVAFLALFRHAESDNTVAYSLVAANFVADGSVRIPQIGSQLGLDRDWLLNSPLMAFGQVPFFLTMGVRRHADLLGVFLLWQFNVGVFWAVFRKSLGFRSFAAPLALTFAVLGHRSVLAELSNQRYCVASFGLVALAFLPTQGSRRPWWQWLAAGLMPLVHPGLILAYAAFLASEAGRIALAYSRPRSDGERPVPSLVGLACFLVTGGLTFAWYGRWQAFRGQFLPHLSFGNFRGFRRLAGMFAVPASPVFALPSQGTSLAFVALGVAVLVACYRPTTRRGVVSLLPPALLIVAIFPIDLTRGFAYYPYAFLGAGPVLLAACRTSRVRRFAIVTLATLSLGNALIAMKVDLVRPDLIDTPETTAFLIAQTRPGDRIVTGPPLILVSALPGLPERRQILRVVPAPYFLDDFKESAYRDDIEATTDVYVGSPRWFLRALGDQSPDSIPRPLLPDAEVRSFRLGGHDVIVARRRTARGR